MKTFVIAIFSLLLVHTCTAGHTIDQYTSTVYLGPYDAKTPTKLEELPTPVQVKVIAYLKDRVGPDFYARLTLRSGQVVDIDELYRNYPRAKDYKWKIFTYRLQFLFSDEPKGIKGYYATLELDADGDVIKDIDLPNIAKDPRKGVLISVDSAIRNAEKQGFSPNSLSIDLRYLPQEDSLAYIISQTTSDDGLVFTIDNLAIAAHTGQQLKRYKTEGIR